jgi:CheY-like chemotaxis protein
VAAPHILIVDDDRDLLESMADVVLSAGFQVSTAVSVDEAIHMLDRPFALVVCDLTLPGEDGRGSLDQLRQSTAAPVGLMSGLLPVPAWASTFSFFLPKPFGADKLLGTIAQALDSQALSDEELGLVKGYFAALEAHRWEALAALCTEDVVYHVPGEGHVYCRTIHGRTELAAYAREVFAGFKGLRFRVNAGRRLPDGLVADYTSTWEGGAMEGTVAFRLRGGQVSHIGVRIDLSRLSSPPVKA